MRGARMRPTKFLGLVLAALIASTSAARAELENENLLAPLPAGYKIGFQERKDNILISEMVPAGETVQNWTEMVTVQIFFNMKRTPEAFKAILEKNWSGACRDSQSKPIAKAPVQGYPSVTWAMFCPLNLATNKPENTWFKAIRGNDSFYLVQKAFKFTPSKEQEAKWLGYLNEVVVCDTRLPDRPCLKAKP